MPGVLMTGDGMGKLRGRGRGSRLGKPRSRFPSQDMTYDQRREATVGWRAWYHTPAWRRLRWRVLVEEMFTCRMCGRAEPDTSQLVADHVEPHDGDETLFWDRGNLQCLCSPCHSGRKQRQEHAART